MSETYITDITHYLNEHGEFPEKMGRPARQLASYLALIIDETTKSCPAIDIDTKVRCRRRNCYGSVHSTLTGVDSEIEWFCPECSDKGYISNWQGSKWDNMKKS